MINISGDNVVDFVIYIDMRNAGTSDLLVKVKERQALKGWSNAELARRAGVSYSSVRFWLNGRAKEPAYPTVRAILNALELGEPATLTPLIGRVPAGVPIRVDGQSLAECEQIYLPQAKAGWFALIVEGDSMNLEVQHGHLIVINPMFDMARLDGRMVVGNFNGDSFFKVYHARPMPMLMPRSLNPIHRPIVPQEGDVLEIKGVVEFSVADYRDKVEIAA